MKRSHAGVALSIAVHAVVGLIGAVVVATPPGAHASAREPVGREPDPLEVEIIDAPPISPPKVAIANGNPTLRDTTAMVVRAKAAQRATRTASTPSAPSIEPSQRTTTDPTAVVPALPPVQTIDHIADPAPTLGEPAITIPAKPEFTMRVDPDGTAYLTDRPNLRFSIGPSAAKIEEERGERWLEEHHEQSNAVDMKMPPAGATIATFDVTDWAMRATGGDPYAHEKLKVLDATRDERARIGARHREQQAIRIPALVRASLAAIVALSPEQRSAALVDLWRDCDDSTAGEIARATIVEYVRTRAEFSSTDRALLARR